MPDGGWSKLLVDSWTAGHFFFNALCGCWASKLPVSLSYWNPEKWCRQPWNIVKDVWNLGENIAAYKNVYLWAVTTIVLSCFVGKINFVCVFFSKFTLECWIIYCLPSPKESSRQMEVFELGVSVSLWITSFQKRTLKFLLSPSLSLTIERCKLENPHKNDVIYIYSGKIWFSFTLFCVVEQTSEQRPTCTFFAATMVSAGALDHSFEEGTVWEHFEKRTIFDCCKRKMVQPDSVFVDVMIFDVLVQFWCTVAQYLWVFPAGNGTLRLRVELPMVQSMEVFCWQKKLVKN